MGDHRSAGGIGIWGILGWIILFLLCRRWFPGFSVALLIFGIGVCVVVAVILFVVLYFAFRKRETAKTESISEEQTQLVTRGRAHLMQARRKVMEVKNSGIRAVAEEIVRTADRIFGVLKEKPEHIWKARGFFHYYLPTFESILEKYVRLEQSQALEPEVEQHTAEGLETMRTALERQYTNLFEEDVLDLTVEMEVLTQKCRQDGLLTEDNTEV